MVYKDTDHDKKIICASVADFNLNNTSISDSLTETMQLRHSLGKRQKYLCTCLRQAGLWLYPLIHLIYKTFCLISVR